MHCELDQRVSEARRREHLQCVRDGPRFAGDIEANRVQEIILASTELMNVETDSVYVFPMCRDDFEKVRIVGQGFDRKLVADEVLTKVI